MIEYQRTIYFHYVVAYLKVTWSLGCTTCIHTLVFSKCQKYKGMFYIVKPVLLKVQGSR